MGSEDRPAKAREHETAYRRTVVIGDIHGDLDTLLRSLAAKKVLRYEGDVGTVSGHVRGALKHTYSRNLEALLIPQEPRLQLIFLGDMVDRWPQGCHVLQFVTKVRWSRFGIDAVFLLGNHDMLNLHFFVNPYRVYEIYKESEFRLGQVMEFIGQMGLPDTLEGFLDLHRREVVALQRELYRTGVLEWDLGYGKLTLSYSRDLSLLLGYEGSTWEDVVRYCDSCCRELGHERREDSHDPIADLLSCLGAYENPGGQNWWSIAPDVPREQYDHGRYPWPIERFNVFKNRRKDEGNDWYRESTYRHLLPVDWRVISLVWRRHYGDYFRQADQIYREGDTLYVHAGISPQAMLDSQAFGVIFRVTEDDFQKTGLGDEYFYSFDRVFERTNRLTRQVLTNALNDYSFSCMSGAEITEIMGVWRGGKYGFTQFGGVYWSDCDYIQHHMRNERVKDLYRKFVEGTPIRRIICGHTRFQDHEKPELRYQQIEQMLELELDYLSVDNSCSRGYRRDKPVLNGIEMDESGRIRDPGGFWHAW